MADKPLEYLAEVEKFMETAEPERHESEMTVVQRLRAFEDEHLGADAVRINGEFERGHGSRYSKMKPSHRAHHDALVELVAAEKAHVDAGATEAAAHARLKAAIERANITEPQD